MIYDDFSFKSYRGEDDDSEKDSDAEDNDDDEMDTAENNANPSDEYNFDDYDNESKQPTYIGEYSPNYHTLK